MFLIQDNKDMLPPTAASPQLRGENVLWSSCAQAVLKLASHLEDMTASL